MADFTFMYPQWLFAALPLALLLPWVKGKAQTSGLIAPHLSKLLSGNRAEAGKQKRWPLAVLAIAWLLSVLALAGPSWQKNEMPAVNLAGARVLVMDMSRSMYATDVSPNRLTQARFKALDMLPGWKEGSTGLVAYAADGYIISPLTDDASTLKTLLPELSPEIMPIPGSNAAAGVVQAMELLSQAGFADGDIVLITDGMTDRESKATLDALDGSQYRVSVLAIGTQQGAPIQLPDGSLIEQNGTPVVAKVTLDTLSPITKATGGILQMWQPTNRDVDNIVAFTEKPRDGAAQGKSKSVEERLNAGFWLIIPVLLLALLGFRRGLVLALMFVMVPIHPVSAAVFQTDDQQAYAQFESGDFEQAVNGFSSQEWKGIAQYKNGDYQGAIETLSALDDPTSRYNLGNAYAQAGELEKAQETFESVLKNDPDNADAKKNLDVVKQALEQQQQQNQDSSGQQSDQSQSEQQQGDQQQGDESQSSQDQSGGQNQEGSDQQGQQNQDQQQGQNSDQQGQSDQQQSDAQSDEQSGQSSDGEQEQEQNAQSQAESESQQGEEQEQSAQASESQPQEGEEGAEADAQGESAEAGDNQDGLSASHPVLKKLEQVSNDTAGLIRAQMLLQARQKDMPAPTENSW
ncbi:vWA domain-containing protein [Enterovibrio norvegicus]|uniref:vWA domain-containing protein n=1 Tax=Enterovibrio norvegicus TaxID=188144 RepID=UPI003551E2D7